MPCKNQIIPLKAENYDNIRGNIASADENGKADHYHKIKNQPYT